MATPKSETQIEYKIPQQRKRTLARQTFMEQMLWNEMTNRYLDNLQRHQQDEMNRNRMATTGTVYHTDYTKLAVERERDTVNELAYPLYGGTVAITYWNATEAHYMRPFKQYHPLTKLNEECLDYRFR